METLWNLSQRTELKANAWWNDPVSWHSAQPGSAHSQHVLNVNLSWDQIHIGSQTNRKIHPQRPPSGIHSLRGASNKKKYICIYIFKSCFSVFLEARGSRKNCRSYKENLPPTYLELSNTTAEPNSIEQRSFVNILEYGRWKSLCSSSSEPNPANTPFLVQM